MTQGTNDAEHITCTHIGQDMGTFTDNAIDHGKGALLLIHSGYAEGTAQQRSSIFTHLHVYKLSGNSLISDLRRVHIN